MRARCGRMNSPLVLNTRSTGAEVAGKQKTFPKSVCKSLKAGFRLTTTHNSYNPFSPFTETPSAYSTYSWTRTHCKTMMLDISHAMLAYSILENFRGLELPRTRTRTKIWKLVLEDPRGQGLSSRTTTLPGTIILTVSPLDPWHTIQVFRPSYWYQTKSGIPEYMTD